MRAVNYVLALLTKTNLMYGQTKFRKEKIVVVRGHKHCTYLNITAVIYLAFCLSISIVMGFATIRDSIVTTLHKQGQPIKSCKP